MLTFDQKFWVNLIRSKLIQIPGCYSRVGSGASFSWLSDRDSNPVFLYVRIWIRIFLGGRIRNRVNFQAGSATPVVGVVYHVTIVPIGHGLLKKFWPLVQTIHLGREMPAMPFATIVNPSCIKFYKKSSVIETHL